MDKRLEQLLRAAEHMSGQLGALDRRERDEAASDLVRRAISAYTELYTLYVVHKLPAEESEDLQRTLERLRAQLRFHGEDV